MSMYRMSKSMYRPLPAGTPGWWMAPVPGWGINPLRAGPARVGVNGPNAIPMFSRVLPQYAAVGTIPESRHQSDICLSGACEGLGDYDYNAYSVGHLALAGGACLVVGVLFGHMIGKRSKR